MSYWQDKSVLVTGGSAGLGRALAGAFARGGAKVAIAARDREALEKTATEIIREGGRALACPADITRDEEVDRLLAEVLKAHGRLDALVNCAGRSARRAILETTPSDFDDLWRLNVLGTVRATRAAAPHLLETKGHVVNIGSLASKTTGPFLGAYPATKHAVAAYSQQLRLELGPKGLHVLLVCPGPIRRDEAGARYADQSGEIPAEAQQPGGGAKVGAIDPDWLACKILRYCERRKPELIVPAKARLLFVLAQISPRLGDWLVRKMT